VRRGAIKHLRHNGVDISAPTGTPIRAAEAGLVIYANDEVRGFGKLLLIVHADGTVTLYAHCNQFRTKPGEYVKRGQIIAEVGATGFAKGPHLHFELRFRGHPLNPQRQLVYEP